MRLGVKVPNTGPIPAERGIGPVSAMLESVGWDSLWVSDHIVMPEKVDSPYPFAPDRKISWSTVVDWYDVMVALAQMAATTSRAELGVGVLVLPLRNPVEFAKQTASIMAQPHGDRLLLGVGSGWLAEEFDALNVPFKTRGSRLDEWMEIIRSCWTGRPAAFEGQHYTVPGGLVCLPAWPTGAPFLIGGNTKVALRRAAQRGAGWMGHYDAPDLDLDTVDRLVKTMRDFASEAGRDPAELRMTLRVVQTETLTDDTVRKLAGLAAVGIHDVVVDVDWSEGDGSESAHRNYTRLREACG
jgi:probable F420-dependent oxidoreductase